MKSIVELSPPMTTGPGIKSPRGSIALFTREELAEHTGGRVYAIDDLESISSPLGRALRIEDLLG